MSVKGKNRQLNWTITEIMLAARKKHRDQLCEMSTAPVRNTMLCTMYNVLSASTSSHHIYIGLLFTVNKRWSFYKRLTFTLRFGTNKTTHENPCFPSSKKKILTIHPFLSPFLERNVCRRIFPSSRLKFGELTRQICYLQSNQRKHMHNLSL